MAYKTSELYKQAISDSVRTTFIDGTLVLSNNNVIPLSNDIISQGSFYVTNQCVSNNSLSFGSVYAGESGVTLKTDIDRYTLFNAKLVPSFNIKLSDETYEKIPIGEFYVNEANRSGNAISLKCYDKMVDLDVELTESTTGTPYDLLSLISTKCGVTLAQTDEEIKSLINGDILLTVDITRVKTYRDLLSLISTITCTFSFIDREGKLRLRGFGKSSVVTFESRRRVSSSFSDFETYYTTVKAKFLSSGEYSEYVSTSGTSGLTMNLGEIPIVQGTSDTNKKVLDNIFDELKLMKYIPCDFKFAGDPSLEMGDMITNIDKNGNELTSYLTFYKWTYRSDEQIKCVGDNPRLSSAYSKEEKAASSQESSINSKTLRVFTFSNASEIKVKGGEEKTISGNKEIAKLAISTEQQSTTMLFCTVYLSSDMMGVIELRTFVDGAYYQDSLIRQNCVQGENTITFVNYLALESNSQYRINVYARTIENEVGTPEITIGKFAIKLMLTGQGLSSEIPWDGVIQFSETTNTYFTLSDELNVSQFSENVGTNLIDVDRNEFNVEVGLISQAEELGVMMFKEVISFNEYTKEYDFETSKSEKYNYNTKFISIIGDEFALKTSYVYSGNEQSIDTGKLGVIAINTDTFASTEDIVITERGV